MLPMFVTGSTKDEDRTSPPVQLRTLVNRIMDKIRTLRERESSQSDDSISNDLKTGTILITSPKIAEIVGSFESKFFENNNVTRMLSKTSKPNKKYKSLNMMLLESLRYREVEEIEKLIIAGANPNATCCIQCISACHLAAMRPDGALALLLSHRADKNRFDKTGRTPVHIAAWAGNLRHIAILLGFSKELTNKVSCLKMTPLLEEELKNLSPYLKEIVNAKCITPAHQTLPPEWMTDHNCKESISPPLFPPGWTPLHAASSRAKSHCVRILLAVGADPSIRDLLGRTPLDLTGSAYYTDGYIDPDSFAETISILAREKSNYSVKNRKISDTPLHTAVELNSINAVKTLLSIDAPIGWLNRAGQSPVHVCVEKMNMEILITFINYRPGDLRDSNFKRAIDLRNKDGRTILHMAILEDWTQGVYIAINAGANVNARDNKRDTPLHLAAATGNLDILNTILNKLNHSDAINAVNLQSETPLMLAVLNRNIECVKILLEEKADVKASFENNTNVFHIAAKMGYDDVLQILLDFDYNVSEEMINILVDDKDGFGAIHYAVHNNHPDCVKLLLSRNSSRNLETSISGTYCGSTPLHIAAINQNIEIAEILIKNNSDSIYQVNNLEWTPLHTACTYGSSDIIKLLLKNGADLSAEALIENTKVTAIELLMNSLSKPIEFMSEIFDSCISTHGVKLQDPSVQVEVDYQILLPTTRSTDQMKVIDAIVQSGDRREQCSLLVHPLLQSFLHLKWKALLPPFYTKIVVYGIYLSVLTMFIFSEFYYADLELDRPNWMKSSALGIALYVSVFFVIALESLYVNFSVKYLFDVETWIKFGAMLLALNIPSAVGAFVNEIVLKQEYARLLATVALLMSWLEMIFLLSRFPKWGYYVPMLEIVSKNVLKIFLTFSFLIIVFALIFKMLFQNSGSSEGIISATVKTVVKTLVTMGSEFDYNNLIDRYQNTKRNVTHGSGTGDHPPAIEGKFSMLMFSFIFVSLFILASMVLVNLMVSVAVKDLQNLQVFGNIKRVTKQVEFLVSLDTLLFNYNRYFSNILPIGLKNFLLKNKTIDRIIVIRPSDPKSKLYKELPTEIRNNIFEKAQQQKKKKEEEIDVNSYIKKLDEINGILIANNNVHGKYLKTGFQNITQLINYLNQNNEQTSEHLRELKRAMKELNIKIDMIFDVLQSSSSD